MLKVRNENEKVIRYCDDFDYDDVEHEVSECVNRFLNLDFGLLSEDIVKNIEEFIKDNIPATFIGIYETSIEPIVIVNHFNDNYLGNEFSVYTLENFSKDREIDYDLLKN